jgi:hypothetical protein
MLGLAMSDELPLILLPGLGADARMFSSLRNGLPQLVTPAWIEPLRGETIAQYARRYAPLIDPVVPVLSAGRHLVVSWRRNWLYYFPTCEPAL